MLWLHLVVRTTYCLLPVGESSMLGGGWCFPFHVKLVSHRRLHSVSASKITAVSKSQSQLPLHMLLCVYSCCHRNVSQVPPFFHIYRGKIAYGNTTSHNNGLTEHEGKGEPSVSAASLANKGRCFLKVPVSLWDNPVISVQFVSNKGWRPHIIYSCDEIGKLFV